MSGASSRACRWVITGRVQGVFYRAFTQQEAQRLGLSGWVRNLPDGSVEAWIVGDREKISRLEERLGEGPRMARVQNIAEYPLEPSQVADIRRNEFEIRY